MKSAKSHRAHKPQDFIKYGNSYCRVTITLNNIGNGQYMHNLFGDKIAITRKVTHNSSTSSYSVVASDGSIISRTKKELDDILRVFNIQIDNPTVIMSQDVTRSFLASDSAMKKYDYFLKATQLSSMLYDHEEAKSAKEKFQRLQQDKTDSLDEYLTELNQLKKKLEKGKIIKKIEDELDHLKSCLVWSKYHSVEVMRDKWLTEYTNAKQSILEYSDTLKETETKIQQFSSVMEQKKQSVGNLNDQLVTYQYTITEYENKKSDVEAEMRRVNSEIQQFKKNVELSYKRIDHYRNELDNIAQNNNRDKNEEVEKYEIAVQDVTRAKGSYEHALRVKKDLQHKCIEMKSKIAALVEEKLVMSDSIAGSHHAVKKLSERSNSKLNYFMKVIPHLKKLWREIYKQKDEFEQLPIGPIGLFLKLNDSVYGDAVEFELKSILNSFICYSARDHSRMKQILAKMNISRALSVYIISSGYRSQVYSNVPVINQSGFSNEFQTVLSILSRDDYSLMNTESHDEAIVLPAIVEWYMQNMDVVYSTSINCLIDWCNIEKTILMNERNKAMNLMFKTDAKQSYRNQIKYCILANGDKLYKMGSSDVYMSRNVKHSYIFADSHEENIRRIEELKQTIKQNEEKYHCKENERLELVRQYEQLEFDLKNAVVQVEYTVRIIETKTHMAKQMKPVTESNADSDNVEHDIQSKMSHEQELIRQNEEATLDLEQSKQDLQNQVFIIQSDIEQEVHALDQLQSNIHSQSRELSQTIKQISTCTNEKKRLEALINEQENVMNVFELRVKEYEQKLTALGEAATTLCTSAPEPIDTPESIQKQISIKERELNHYRSSLKVNSFDELEQMYYNNLKIYNNKKELLEISGKCLEKLREGLNIRMKKWERMRKVLQSMSSKSFNTYLTRNGHSGKLIFDDQAKTLNIEVRLDASGSGGGGGGGSSSSNTSNNSSNNNLSNNKDVIKTLSGGEKSYSTVCFILALMDFVEVPFRILDEFDVAMDAVYRKKALAMILEKAYSERKQLILISPLDTTQIGQLDSDKISLFRLQEPVR
jgi:chromosome segregation ATPase